MWLIAKICSFVWSESREKTNWTILVKIRVKFKINIESSIFREKSERSLNPAQALSASIKITKNVSTKLLKNRLITKTLGSFRIYSMQRKAKEIFVSIQMTTIYTILQQKILFLNLCLSPYLLQ